MQPKHEAHYRQGNLLSLGTEQRGMSVAQHRRATALPPWIPEAVKVYLSHTGLGISLRELARVGGVHASTVMRQVRRFELRRDDPLVDEALSLLERLLVSGGGAAPEDVPDTVTLRAEAQRVLRRMLEPGVALVIAPGLEKAAVLKFLPGNLSHRVAVVERAVARAFALNEWVSCSAKQGRVTRYEITPLGRALVKGQEAGYRGLSEATTPFIGQQASRGGEAFDEDCRPKSYSFESPVAMLGRRRDRDGQPFLDHELVQAAERLREDYELARMGTPSDFDWAQLLQAGAVSGGESILPTTGAKRSEALRARARVEAALRHLGPGLGDMALRCCCYLEGLETAEQQMGWSARSGKIVLRIALQRLCTHYAQHYGPHGPKIG